ncbi:MAG: hypothetical protein HOC97_09435, partial [Lentimicrobiaceae bacterium]|nr:hypothetical protein [Lentimicrobiaceae bacterium]
VSGSSRRVLNVGMRCSPNDTGSIIIKSGFFNRTFSQSFFSEPENTSSTNSPRISSARLSTPAASKKEFVITIIFFVELIRQLS